MFLGTYAPKLDDKGRIILPAKFRDELSTGIVMTRGQENCLYVFSTREFENLHGLGQVLIGVRIARGMTQRELARRLGVDETMVSRDERNEYHGISLERAQRVLDALHESFAMTVEERVPPAREQVLARTA
jgi:division/cell wall cluster transcriptional repressor MraZ